MVADCSEDFAGGPIGTIHKVSAHLARQTAIREGWEVARVGNDIADALAKEARPEVEGNGTLWVFELRQAAKALEMAVAAVPAGFLCRPFWHGAGAVGKGPRAPEPAPGSTRWFSWRADGPAKRAGLRAGNRKGP